MAATAAPTTDFGEKRKLAQVFDELSPPFDPAKFAASQKKVKEEKVRTMVLW